MNWVNILTSILSGLAVLIPLVIELVKYVQAATKEKNWSQMLKLVMNLMAKAEAMFDKGAEKKEWVLEELRAVADTLNYDIDWAVISNMIDSLCDMAKEVN